MAAVMALVPLPTADQAYDSTTTTALAGGITAPIAAEAGSPGVGLLLVGSGFWQCWWRLALLLLLLQNICRLHHHNCSKQPEHIFFRRPSTGRPSSPGLLQSACELCLDDAASSRFRCNTRNTPPITKTLLIILFEIEQSGTGIYNNFRLPHTSLLIHTHRHTSRPYRDHDEFFNTCLH